MSTHHRERLVEELRQEIEVMLAGELKDPRLDLSLQVTEVRLSPDRRQAKVYLVVRGSEDEQAAAIAALETAAGFIRHELTERLQLRRSPQLLFTIDHSVEYGEHIEELLRRVKGPSET
jgi:ribosome-binding factor A